MNCGQKMSKTINSNNNNNKKVNVIKFGTLFFINYLMNYRLCVVVVILFIAFNLSGIQHNGTINACACAWVYPPWWLPSFMIDAAVHLFCTGPYILPIIVTSNCEQINLTWHRNKWTLNSLQAVYLFQLECAKCVYASVCVRACVRSCNRTYVLTHELNIHD